MTDTDNTVVPEYLPPAAIAEYISYDQCARYAKHRIQDVDRTANHQSGDFREGFEPLNILFSAAGEDFETTVSTQANTHTRETIDLQGDSEDDDEQFRENHEQVLQHIQTAVAADEVWNGSPVMLYQASLAGQINGQGIRGDSDNLFVWSTQDGAEVRVVDIKRTTEEKVYHQLQATAYVAILRQLIEQTDAIPAGAVTVSGGVITQETSIQPVTPENLPSFDVEPRIADLHRMLRPDSALLTALKTRSDEVAFQLDSKCNTCPYNEGCVTESFEQNHIRLLGLTVAQQQTLIEHDVTTVADVAALCRTPDEDKWEPTTYKDGSMPSDTYKALARTPTIGDQLPHLVYKAKAMLDAVQAEPTGAGDRPQNWLPGSGRCSLPDDEPSDAAPGGHDWQDGTMVRIYLNVQYDHLRDRLIQLSARVTATAGETGPQRCSVVSAAAPDDPTAAQATERSLLEDFCTELFDAIRTVRSGISFETEQDSPPIHFYLYTEQEYEKLFEAFDRHQASDAVGAFRSAVEGVGQPDDAMVSTLRSVVENHIILETPSPGLLHAYRELYPTADGAYSKSRTRSAWSYDPPNGRESYDLRQVFARRFFDTGVAADRPDEDLKTILRQRRRRFQSNYSAAGSASGDSDENPWEVDVDPTTPDRFDGLNTRMRYGASIPLAYVWAAIGRIDDSWAEKEAVDDSALAKFELGRYRYRDSDRTEELTSSDIEILGRHLCDVLEHVERALTYKDSLLLKTPYPIGTLDTDTFSPPTLAAGAEQYLLEEYRANREEKHQIYRQFPLQRILTGESIPVYVENVTERNSSTLEITGKLRYDDYTLFGEAGEQIKRACRKKGAQGTSSGSWMVANPYHPGATGTAVTRPYEVEQGVNATVERLDTDNDTIRISLRNFWTGGSEFGQRHAKWTTDADRAADDNKLHIESGKWLILDPQTDDITADRVQDALEHVDTNALHHRLEAVRNGSVHNPETPLFSLNETSSADASSEGVNRVASWLHDEVNEDTYPSLQQREFITETDSQFVALQGPPGTGKTAATMAPALLARLYAGARNGRSINGLVTAPSNTAIDELLADVAELLATAERDGPLATTDLDIELVRIGEVPDQPVDGVTYVNYNNNDHAPRVNRIIDRLQTQGSPSGPREDGSASHSADSADSDGQASLATFTAGSSADEKSHEDSQGEPWTTDSPLTLVFATSTRSWRFLKEVAPGSNPDDRVRAEQQLWHLLAVDEASMLELPTLLLAGSAFRSDGQLLVGGDHRQLPPVQKYDWDNVHQRSIRSTAAYLSTLDYLRLLRGDEVLPPEQQAHVACDRDAAAIQLPLVRLGTTYRFDDWVAEFIRQAVYEQDDIKYSSGRDAKSVPSAFDEPDEPLESLFSAETTVALLTYDGKGQYQQWNPVETLLTQALVMAVGDMTDVGVVTPHNAQRGRVQSALQEKGYSVAGSDTANNPDAESEPTQDVQVETVNRFQGGERDMMVVNATVSDPNYIAAEEDFLLTENRINVSFTRHQDLLVVVAPETLLGHLPQDPDLYDQACLWKTLAIELGEVPTAKAAAPDWKGPLKDFLMAAGIKQVSELFLSELKTTVSAYTNHSKPN